MKLESSKSKTSVSEELFLMPLNYLKKYLLS